MFSDIQTTRRRYISNNAERNTIMVYFFIFDGEINFVWYIKVLIIMLVKTDILDTIPYKYQ